MPLVLFFSGPLTCREAMDWIATVLVTPLKQPQVASN